LETADPIISAAPCADVEDVSEELSAELEVRDLAVAVGQHGERLDRVLAGSVAEFSRSYLQQLIEAGHVCLNGQRLTKVSQKLKAGDRLRLELRPTPQSQAFKPEPQSIDAVFEDEHLLVINKPPGLVVHPAPGNWSGTLLNGLLARHACFSLVPRAGIVHRLDKDTSGLMVVAKHRAAMDALVDAIAERSVSRQYLALAQPAWSLARHVTVESAIGRDPRNRLRMAVVDLATQAGKSARTDVALVANATDGCYVRCTLHTGRTHQIRVHLASLGYPLVADVVYGAKAHPAMARQALHAFRLAFLHPVTGEALQFEVPPPADFLALLADWGLRYNRGLD